MSPSRQESSRSCSNDRLPRPFRHNSYALAGLFLAPGKDRRTLAQLRAALQREAVEWGPVLRQTNRHFSTPLLYSRLWQDALLPAAPAELQEYLHCLHTANGERNEAFRLALRELLQIAKELAIPCLLLKGAASFCDNLYNDPAARMLGDLDILVAPASAQSLWQALIKRAGYAETPDARIADYSLFAPDFQPHHLPRLCKHGTPVAVEIHFRPLRGLAGRIMSPDFFWTNRILTEWGGLPVSLPAPTCRLLHASLHGLLPQREFIHSNISLAALAEFNLLRQHYSLSLEEAQQQSTKLGFGREFRAFAHLAQRMTAAWPPPRVDWRTRCDTARILAAGIAEESTGPSGMVARLWVREFYQRHRCAWIWRNVCYAEGWRQSPHRLVFIQKWLFGSIRTKWAQRQERKLLALKE